MVGAVEFDWAAGNFFQLNLGTGPYIFSEFFFFLWLYFLLSLLLENAWLPSRSVSSLCQNTWPVELTLAGLLATLTPK